MHGDEVDFDDALDEDGGETVPETEEVARIPYFDPSHVEPRARGLRVAPVPDEAIPHGIEPGQTMAPCWVNYPFDAWHVYGM